MQKLLNANEICNEVVVKIHKCKHTTHNFISYITTRRLIIRLTNKMDQRNMTNTTTLKQETNKLVSRLTISIMKSLSTITNANTQSTKDNRINRRQYQASNDFIARLKTQNDNIFTPITYVAMAQNNLGYPKWSWQVESHLSYLL